MPTETKIDISKHFSHEALTTVHNAQVLADGLKHSEVEPIHLLSSILEREDVREVFTAAGADTARVQKDTATLIRKIATNAQHAASLSKPLMALLSTADKEGRKEAGFTEAKTPEDEYTVSIANILNALSHEVRSSAGVVLQASNLGPGTFRPHTSLIREDGSVAIEQTSPPEKDNKLTRNLVELARRNKFDPTIGRDDEVRRLLQVLARRTKHNPLLIGQVGVGKYSIVSEVATRLANGTVPEHLKRFSLLELNTSTLLSGAKLRGDEIDKRLNAVFKMIAAAERETILYVRGIESLVDQPSGNLVKAILAKDIRVLASTSPEGLRKMADKDPTAIEDFTVIDIEPSTVEETAAILRALAPRYEAHHRLTIGEEPIAAAVRLAKRYLQDRALPEPAIDLIDEAAARKRMELDGVPASMDAARSKLLTLKMQFNSLANDDDAASVKVVKVLEQSIASLEPEVRATTEEREHRRGVVSAHKHLAHEYAKLGRQLEDARSKKDYTLAGKIEHDSLPAMRKRVDAAADALAKLKPGDARVLTEEDVAHVLEELTGIPCKSMLESEVEKLKGLEDSLRKSVVGQDEAVSAVSQAVRRARLGLRDPKRPVGSFLFLGSSGVGKTLIAETLTQELFGSSDAMLRLDMAEYREQHQAQKLIGSPQGYIGSGEGGLLVNFLTQKPNSLLLLDELEKSSEALKDLFLGVLDSGRISSGTGKLADCSNTVIVMTSNIGTRRLLDADPKMFDTEEGRKELADALLHNDLANALRPEFINRIDKVIIFRPLLKDTLLKIADIELCKVNKLLEYREMSISVSDAAKQALVDEEANPAFGARPLRRAISNRIQTPLTDVLMNGGYKPGDVIAVDYTDGKFVFNKLAS